MADVTAAPVSGRELAGRLGPLGAWSFELDRMSAAEARAYAQEVEALGYRALWIPESVNSKEVFAHATFLLAATSRLIVATGIANIYARDPVAMANGARFLAEAYPARFVLGLGVSHKPAVERRGGSYGRPLEAMAEYLDAMTAAAYAGPAPAEPAAIVLAALGPRMLELGGSRTAGVHPYFAPPAHAPFAREHAGSTAVVAFEQAAVIEGSAGPARIVARNHVRRYLRLENYANNLRRMGFTDGDIEGEGSDALVDAIVAWGSADQVAGRVRQLLATGADHVCIQALPTERMSQLDQLRALAGALL
jgi:probable F420-dependent oxidoreductase